MTTGFPTSLDSYTRPSGASGFNDASATDGTVFADNVYDAVEALEASVGITASAVTTTLRYLVNHGIVAADSSQTGKVTATLAATTNDYNPGGLSTVSALRLTSSVTNVDITGLQGGAEGRLMWVTNAGASNTLTLKNQSASSTAANRFNPNADVILQPLQSALLRYDGVGSRWNVLQAPTSGATTVFSGDVQVPLVPAATASAASKDYVDTEVAGVSPISTTGFPAFIQYTAGAWPARTTATSDSTKMVIWKGPTASPPTIGGAGNAINGIDVFFAEA